MKLKIIKLLKEKKEVHLTMLPTYIPEIKGKFAMYLPTKIPYNNNILLLSDVNNEFIEVYNELLKEGFIELKEASIAECLFTGNPMYDLPLLSRHNIKKQKECWQPSKIVLRN